MMFQSNVQWRGHVGRSPVVAAPMTYAKFPALASDFPDGSPAWVKLVAHQFHDPGVLLITCQNTPDVRGRLWPAYQASMRGETRSAFAVVAVASFINQGRALDYRVALEEVRVVHLQFLPNQLLEAGMMYQRRTGFLPSGVHLGWRRVGY